MNHVFIFFFLTKTNRWHIRMFHHVCKLFSKLNELILFVLQASTGVSTSSGSSCRRSRELVAPTRPSPSSTTHTHDLHTHMRPAHTHTRWHHFLAHEVWKVDKNKYCVYFQIWGVIIIHAELLFRLFKSSCKQHNPILFIPKKGRNPLMRNLINTPTFWPKISLWCLFKNLPVCTPAEEVKFCRRKRTRCCFCSGDEVLQTSLLVNNQP